MADAIEYRNDLNQIRWQPVTKRGEQAVLDELGMTWKVHTAHRYLPKLYRSRARALRVARRQEKHEDKRSWRQMRRQDDGGGS